MITIFKKVIVLINLLIILLTLCGCWDFSELDQTAIVTGFGIDLDENDQVILTYQVLKPSGGKKQGAATGDTTTVVLEDSGKTLFDAIRDASTHSSKKLFFAHSQIIVLGQRAAKVNPEGLLRLFRRDHGSRTIDYIVVAENTASEVINAKGGLDKIQAHDLATLISDHKESGKIVPTELADLTMAMLSKTKAPVAPIAKIDDENRSYLSGTAVFRNNKLVGSLNDDETRGYLWITNQLDSGSVTIKDEEADALMAFEIIKASSSYKASFQNNKIVFDINLKATTNLINSIKSTENVTVDDLIEMQKEVITKKVDMALNKAILYKADIFGFANHLYSHHYQQWKSVEDNWDHVFTTIDYNINIDLKIKSQGLLISKFKEE